MKTLLTLLFSISILSSVENHSVYVEASYDDKARVIYIGFKLENKKIIDNIVTMAKDFNQINKEK